MLSKGYLEVEEDRIWHDQVSGKSHSSFSMGTAILTYPKGLMWFPENIARQGVSASEKTQRMMVEFWVPVCFLFV